MVLTRIAWAAIVTSALMVSYDLHLRRGIEVHASVLVMIKWTLVMSYLQIWR